jgi:hypothetical protein
MKVRGGSERYRERVRESIRKRVEMKQRLVQVSCITVK